MDTSVLRGKMRQLGYTQKQIAGILQISENTLCRKLKSGVFRSDELEALIGILGLPPESIFLGAAIPAGNDVEGESYYA